jgi:hypothetical protein
MSITIEDMRSKLVSMETLHQRLQQTEPLSVEHLSTETSVSFRFDPDWMSDAEIPDIEPVRAYITVDGTERQMTKGAAFQAAANVGIPAALAKRLPSPNLERDLDYFYSSGGRDKEYNMLAVGERVSAFTRPTIVPFSNLQLLEQTIDGIANRFGPGVEVFADYKFMNTLARTDIRLIVPEYRHVIEHGDMPDVPEGEQDEWMAGVHLFNSAIGKGQTTMDAYLFRYWCTNGESIQNDAVGIWSRRHDGQQEDVYEWARQSVDDVFSGLTERFKAVQSLVSLEVPNIGEVLSTVFGQYDVPVSHRDLITDAMVNPDMPRTMYAIMNAITGAANDMSVSMERADRLMRIGGGIPTETFDPMKAKIWREGHAADTTSQNPYEIRIS